MKLSKLAFLLSIGMILLLAGCTASPDGGTQGAGKLPAPPAQCADSDGGINFAVRGTAMLGAQRMTDTCTSATKLTEYSCTVKNGVARIQNSGHTCAPNEVCRNGACVAAPVQQCEQISDYAIRHVINGQSQQYNNRCTNSPEGYVEYECLQDGSYRATESQCGNDEKCMYDGDGGFVCLPYLCTETETGVRITNATVTDFEFTNYCRDALNRYVYACVPYGNGERQDARRIPCEAGHMCEDGVCVPAENDPQPWDE